MNEERKENPLFQLHNNSNIIPFTRSFTNASSWMRFDDFFFLSSFVGFKKFAIYASTII